MEEQEFVTPERLRWSVPAVIAARLITNILTDLADAAGSLTESLSAHDNYRLAQIIMTEEVHRDIESIPETTERQA